VSFTPLMMKLVASHLDELPEAPSVIELGNQTFDPTLSGSLTEPEDLMFPLVLDFLARRGKAVDRARLQQLMAMSPAEQKPHTASYYTALGFRSYDAIDVNSMYGSLIMDLNVDLREAYGFETVYDLVTNNGTGEHVFNQAAVFKNMHQLTRVGGVMLFVLPFYNWLNHGFFNFNPLVFTDLAAANGYEILRLGVGCAVGQQVAATGARVDDRQMRLRWQPDTPVLSVADFQSRGAIKPRTPRNMASDVLRVATGRPTATQVSPLPGVIERLAERVPNINVIAAVRKTRDLPFAMPLQGMYAGQNVEAPELRQQYSA
jgi:SAM-dependent methyltransferase